MPLTHGLPLSRLVSVQVSLTTPAVVAESVNTCMIIGTSAAITPAERARSYADILEVGADFGSASEEFLAAELWFSQMPSPHVLMIGRWIKDPAAGALVGAPLPVADQLIGNWNTITDGEFDVAIDGTLHNVTGLDFSAQTNLNGVASVITAGLGGAGTLVWNANQDRFELTSATTGAASSVGFLTTPAGGTGTDIADQLGMAASSSGAFASDGVTTETALEAAIALDQMFSSQWYAFVCPSADDTDHQMLAAYAEASGAASPTPHYYGITTSEAGSIVSPNLPGGQLDIGYTLNQFGFNKTAVIFSRSPYAMLSYLARILTTHWTGQNTTITLMYKQLPGVAPENLSTTQADALRQKEVNVYTVYSNGARLVQYGTSASGQFTDTIIGADALALDLQGNIFNVLYTTPTKVPQTDPGMQLLVNAAVATCSSYAANGWLGTGVWNAQGFGTLQYGDLLPSGFYVFAPSMLLQSQADRAARRSPLIQVAAKTAGAIHTSSVVIYVNQ